MRLKLTAEQAAELQTFLSPGVSLLARVGRETFDGTNAATSGSPYLEFKPLPNAELQVIRQAISDARTPKPKKAKRKLAGEVSTP